MTSKGPAILLLFVTAVLWSTGGVLIKGVDWSAPAIAGTRSAIAAVVLLAFIRRRNFTWSFDQWGGAVAYAATLLLFVAATKMTTAANAILIQYASPVYVALLAPWFLKEKTHRADWFFLAAILAGLGLFFVDKLTAAGFWGNILAVLSGVSFAWLAMFLRRQKAGSPLESVFLGNLIAAAVGLAWIVGSGPAPQWADLGLFHVNLAWVWLALLGVFQVGLAYVFYTKAIRRVTALEAMLIPAFEPVLNPVLVYLALGEQPGSWAFLGGAIVLAAAIGRAVLTARETDALVPAAEHSA